MNEQPSRLARLFAVDIWARFWLPLVGTVLAMPLGFLCTESFPVLANVLGGVFLIGALYFFIAMLVWFVQRRFSFAFAALACLVLAFGSLTLSIVAAMVHSMTAEDTFATNLSLPADVDLQIPLKQRGEGEAIDDGFQRALRQSLVGTGTNDPSFHSAVPSLAQLHETYPDLLQQVLAASPAWRVYREDHKKFATRRWVVDDRWKISLHGYYSNFHGPDGPSFQTRTTLGFSGKPWANTEKLPANQTVSPTIRMGNSMHESHVFFDESGVLVELFEQSETPERRLTKAAIAALDSEFSALLAAPTWDQAKSLLPEGAIVTGTPSFLLYHDTQPGIYNAAIRCNPGEPGQLYLTAFEITQGIELSKRRLRERSNEFVGWSDDPRELFLAEVHFTIYEGDWGQFYGARFEVWFQPDSGEDDRKLLESNWKIEGWMR